MTSPDPYERSAGFYDRLVEPMQAGVRKVGLSLLPPDPDWHVLDVGCGTGTGLAAYADAGCTAVGVDVSEAMLSQARARLGDKAELHLTGGDVLPFEEDRFDLVMTSMVIHEIPSEDRAGFVAEMARVTKPDGRMMVVDFRHGSLRWWKGPAFRGLSWTIELFSGHFSGYQSFKAQGGMPSLIDEAGLTLDREKIVAGGNVAVYVIASPT